MNKQLKRDQCNLQPLLTTAVQAASQFFESLDDRKAAVFPRDLQSLTDLPEVGLGTNEALKRFRGPVRGRIGRQCRAALLWLCHGW